MKEVIVSPTHPQVSAEIRDADIPAPQDDQVLIRVVVSSSNPKDYKLLYSTGSPLNSGDDVAGFVEAVGKNVASTREFKRGDRVAALHILTSQNGTYAEYTIAPQNTTFIIPDSVSFESAVTIPLTTLSTALALFRRQDLPTPWMKRSVNSPPVPLIIYGASSALGNFAVKLARHANIHPIIAVAGGSSAYVKKFLDPSQGDTLVDYRQGVDKMKAAIKDALKGAPVYHALDAISEKKTWVPVSQVLSPGGVVSVVQGTEKYDEPDIPADIRIIYNFVGTGHTGAYLPNMPKQPDPESVKADPDFAHVLFRYIPRMLSRGEFEGHPYEIIPGGLAGVETGLQKLQRGEAKGVKYVYEIGSAAA